MPKARGALWLALVGAALACGLAWLAWPGREARTALERPAREPRAADAGEPNAVLAQPLEREREVPEASGGPPALEPAGIRVVVVDAAGAAVAGVPVGLAWRHPRLPFAREIAEAATDADGRASFVPPADKPGSELRLVAAVLLPEKPPLEHELEPGASREVRFTLPAAWRAWLAPLVVRVLDTGGAPVSGADIELRTLLPDQPGTSGSHLGRFVTAAPDGSARIERSALLRELRQARQVGTRLAFELAVVGPCAEPPRRVLAEAELGPPPPEVVLVLPPTGRVEVEVRGASGPARVRMRWRAGDQAFEGWLERPVVSGVDRGAAFERVGLGLELELEAWPDDLSVESGRARLRGPQRPGESVRAELALGAPRPVLAGRWVDAARAPLRELRFHLSFHHDPPDLGSPAAGPTRVATTYHVTDADGRFRIPLVAGAFGPRQAELVESAPRSGAPPGWSARFARVRLPDPLAAGQVVDLGELELAATPLLVAGAVTDARGAPVAGARLRIEYPLGAGREERWFNLPHPVVSSDAEGAFEVRHLLPVPRVRVGAERKGVGVAAPVSAAPGNARLRLVLVPEDSEPTGTLSGSLLLDDGLDPTLLEARCRVNGETHESYVIGGHFGFSALPAGQATVEIRTYTTGWSVARVEGVQVLANQANSDPRLDALDLRGDLRYLRLRLVAANGQPLAGILVWLRAGGEGSGALKTDDAGRLVALTRTRDSEFELATNEFEPVRVPYAQDEQELVLLPDDGH